jgi:hypothetical protein
MEMDTVEAEPSTLVAKVTEGTTLDLGTVVAPEVRVETHVNSLPGTSTDVVIYEPEIEEATPIHSALMSEAMSTSRGGLELLDDNLIDPAIIARSMESMRHTKQWIKVRCEYLA